MTKIFFTKHFYLLLLSICLISRLLTTIYYIEDPDSLRFALAALDYDVAKMQPHFPAYPVFCALVKALLVVIPRYALAFSIVGGLSTFVIIYCSIKILEAYQATDFWKITITLLVFFNPLIWLLSNRYMPDLMGMAVVMIALYIWLHYDTIPRSGFWLGLTIGILFGVRLSYVPFLILPAVVLFFSKSDKIQQLLGGFIGIFIWLIPLIIDTGLGELIRMALSQTDGHFNDFGGTVQTEQNFGFRIHQFILHGWADGLGGYWIGRHWSTILVSLGLVLFSSLGIFQIFKTKKITTKQWILIGSILIYALWAFFYQNIVFKSRHHLPLILMTLFLVGMGLKYIYQLNQRIFYSLFGFFVLANIYLTTNLVLQHKNPTAISQLKDYLQQNANPQISIITSEMVQFYLKKQGIRAEFHDINDKNLDLNTFNEKEVLIIANFKTYRGKTLRAIQTFHHNPYVNRMWSSIILNQIE